MDPRDPFRRPTIRPVHPAARRTRAEERMEAIDVSPAKLAAEVERLTRERDAALRRVRDAEAAAATAVANAQSGNGGGQDGARGGAAAGPKGAAPGGDAASALAAAEQAREEYLAALQRERAEFQNFKRRTAEEREASLGLAAEALITKVLAVADDFDRAIETRPEEHAEDPWAEGIAAIDRKLRLLLESEGVTHIEATRGSMFDPRLHEAVANVPGSGMAEGRIVDELRRGYRLRDRVIRPALVAVAGGDAPDAGDLATADTDESTEPNQ
jgi:molecular chaperone GrpE